MCSSRGRGARERVVGGDGLLVRSGPLGLAHERTIPVEPQSPKVGELGLLYPRAYTRAVEILDANEEARPGRTGEQPGQEGGAEVAEVKRVGGAGGEAPIGVRYSPCGGVTRSAHVSLRDPPEEG